METADYFACLEYGKIEILIPQHCIHESDYVGSNKLLKEDHDCHHSDAFMIDQFVCETFGYDDCAITSNNNSHDYSKSEGLNPFQQQKIKTHLEIQDEEADFHFEIRTSLIPTVQRIEWRDIKLLGCDLENFLSNKGFVGFRFNENRFKEKSIQFLTDPILLYKASKKIKENKNV